MSPRDFAKVDALFNQVTALPESERLAFLRKVTTDETTLFEEVSALLEHHASPHEVFDLNAADVVSQVVAARESSPGAFFPKHIGPFRILRLIDRGGMGVVYLAEQREPERLVALKVLHSDLITPGRLRRFAQEVQLLARLRHPCIAQVYEAGSHDFGDGSRPWFAMEFIDGPPITEFVRQHKLETPERLRLMISVCDAVQHAHQRGVIHRDLKPGNILVSDEAGTDLSDSTFHADVRLDSRPKVLDFGIARATDREMDHSTMHTQTGQLLGTLPYMSPEQVGEDSTDLDVRSDVYALGVILYEVLTGRLPYDVKDRPIATVARIIAETEPVPLSSVDRTLRGDLEQIVRKSLAKDKRERYQSASALADDLIRYLNDEPVMARPLSAWYQCRKFTQRNRTLVASALILLVVLLASSVISTSLFVRAERETRAKENQVFETQWEAYIANIAAAHSALREGRAADARQFLKLAPIDRRGWEWRHLNGLLDRATLTLEGSDSYVEDAVFAAGDTVIITGNDAGHLHRYDAKTGELLAVHENAHEHWIHDLDLHPSRELLAVASSDRTIGIFDARTLELVKRHGPLATPLRIAIWSRDGKTLFCGLSSGPILQIDSEDGHVIRKYEGHNGIVEKLALSSDGRILISGSGDRTIRVWDTNTAQQRTLFETESNVFSVCISPDDRLIAGTQAGGFVSVFDIEREVRIAHWRADFSHVISSSFSQDGATLATGSKSSRLRIWETGSWRMVTELLGHAGPVRSLMHAADGHRLVSASEDYTAKIWDFDTFGVEVIYDNSAWVYDVEVSAHGARVASATGSSPLTDGTVHIFDLNDGAETRRLESNSRSRGGLFHISASDDLSTIVTQQHARIIIWHPISDEVVKFELPSLTPSSTMSPDGRYAAFALWESPRVHAIDLEKLQVFADIDLTDIIGENMGLSGIAFAPSGNSLVVASDEADSIVVLTWPEGRIERTHTLKGIPDDPVRFSMAFTSDGRILAIALEGQIELLDFATWMPVASVSFTARYAKLAFSPDGTRLFAGCDDGSIRIWDLPSFRPVGTFYVHPTRILDLDISKDGTTIVTGSIDTTIRVLKAPPRDSMMPH